MDLDFFYTVADTIGDAVVAALQAEPESGGVPAKMRLAYPVWGDVALDDCGCGILSVSLGRRFDSSNFPNEVNSTATRAASAGCGVGLPAMDFVVHLARCQPAPDDRGRPPTVARLQAAARVAAVDTEVVRCVLYTVLRELKRDNTIDDYRVLASQPVGPEGACGGYATPFTVGAVS